MTATGRPTGSSLAQLESSLAAAGSVAAAADVAVAHLKAAGIPFPSLYLEQAGRLRCTAHRGYWQVIDGIPCEVGILGRCFRSGRTEEVVDASLEEEFLFAAPDLRRQISVPIRHADRVVGVLSGESRQAFPPGARALLEDVAATFEARVMQLGGPPPESPAQRVARLATAMTELDSELEIRQLALEGATEVTGMPTAALIERHGPEQARIVAAIGPLSTALTEVDPRDLGQLDGGVLAGTSLFANGTAASDLEMHGHLQQAGVAALAVVPLTVSGDHLGSLLVAAGSPRSLDALVMPSLEILGAQAAASIRAVRTIAQLRRRARQDPLTELGHHATFHEELRARLARLAPDRRLALLMIDVDDFKLINDRSGHPEGDRVLRELSAALGAVLRLDDRLYRVGGDEFATLLEVADFEEAQHIARRMIAAARSGPTTLSVGVAIAHPGEAADQLVHRADDAMYRAKRAGGDTARLSPQTSREPEQRRQLN